MLIHKIILYFSFLSFPFLICLSFLTYKNWTKIKQSKKLFSLVTFLFLLSFSFIYARFIEPNIILTKKTNIEVGFSARMIVVSDIHLGVYKDRDFLEKIVKKINKIENVDAVLIPGDFTYYPEEGNLKYLFEPFKNIKYPVFAVLGNHDDEHPGSPIQKELQEALENVGVTFINNTSTKIGDIALLGLGDKFAGKDDISKIADFKDEDNLIVITHNPDTVMEYESLLADLTVTGHTHGGQIRLPFIYKKAIPCVYNFDQGLYNTEKGKVFVSSGMGVIGLPMRLGIPPMIEVLELY